eukprot:266886_1
MVEQQQEYVHQKRTERIRNARSSLTTTKKVLGALFVWMWMAWVTNFNVMDSLRTENDSIFLTDIKDQLEQKTRLRLRYIDEDDNEDVSTKIVGNPAGKNTSREDNAGRQESGNIYSKKEEHSQHQYCTIGLKPNNECFDMLSPNLKRKRAWHFMGDSQMGFTFHEIVKLYPYRRISTRTAPDERCGFLEYCNLENRSEWDVQGAQQTQGPVYHGFENHFCSDLSGFRNTMFEGDKNNFIEYLAVEYASDVEQQTPTTNTTQQTTSLYLRNQLQQYNLTTDDRACVVNAGVHDQNICAVPTWIPDEQCSDIYMTNVETYLKELDSVCGYIVWISITSCLNDVRYPQKNSRSIKWNRGVESLMNRLYPEKSFFVDVWEKSSNTTHLDNIHFEASYYKEVASLFTSLM